MSDHTWTDGSGRLELNLPDSVVNSVATSGDNTAAARAATMVPELAIQLAALDMPLVRQALREVGIDDVDGMNDQTVHMYLIWIACWDIADGATS